MEVAKVSVTRCFVEPDYWNDSIGRHYNVVNRQSIPSYYYCLQGVENDNFRIVVDFNEKAKISAKNMQESERRKVLAVADTSMRTN